MPIAICSDHLDAAKAQAYNIRDKLLSFTELEGAHSLYTKARFLNFWAKALGYDDWGAFQAKTRHGHKENTNTTIISSETLVELAKHLRESSYIGENEAWLFESILLSCAYLHERQTFHDEELNHYEIVIGSKQHPIMLEMGPDKHNRHIVSCFFFEIYNAQLTEGEIEERLLAYFKRKRDALDDKTQSNIKQLYYDVYPKSGKRIDVAIKEAVDSGWISQRITYQYASPKKIYSLTQRAINYLYMALTDDYCQAWVKWNSKIDEIMRILPNESLIEPKHSRVKAYRDNMSPDDYASRYLAPAQNDDNTPCLANIRKDIPHYSGSMYVFHLLPYLILPPGHHKLYHLKPKLLRKHSTVEVAVTYYKDEKQVGTEEFHTFSGLSQPFINPCHVLAKGQHEHPGKYIDVSHCDKIVTETIWVLRLKNRLGGEDKVTLYHDTEHHLTRHNNNKLYASHSNANSCQAPYSFTKSSQIIGCAKTEAQIETIERCNNQLYYFEAYPESSMVRIKESVTLNPAPLYGYRFV